MKNFYSLKTNLQTADAGYVTFTKILFVLTSLLIIASPIFSQSNDSTQVATAAKDDVFMPKLQKYLTPDGKGNLTFTPGVRMQVRYEYNTFDQNNDFFIRRMRVKGSGNIFDVASYNFELKIDNTGRFNASPLAFVEHAWFTFPVIDEVLTVRIGQEDNVFSRNALTSDSKLLFMERSLIMGALSVLGICDNTIGIFAYGRPMGGRLTYSAGISDNIGFETQGRIISNDTILTRQAKGAMVQGRLVYDFLDPANPKGSYDDYQSSYLGEGKRLTLGANVAYNSRTEIGDDVFALTAYGVDLFFNYGPFTLEGEYDGYTEDFTTNGKVNLMGDGWYAQGGYLIFPKWEVAFRYQQLDFNDASETDKLNWTSIGLNYYIRGGHTFKVQAEYTIKKEQGTEIDNDIFAVQLQLSF